MKNKKSFVIFFFIFSFWSLFADTNAQILEKRAKLIDYAKTFIGTPYVYGGNSKQGIDCSGFVHKVAYDAINYTLPRTAITIFNSTIAVNSANREQGDLVFFKTENSSTVNHVGIYIGRNQFIHAASSGPNTGVIVSSLSENYWKNAYYTSGRFLPSTVAKNETPSTGGTNAKNEKTSRTKRTFSTDFGISIGICPHDSFDDFSNYSWNIVTGFTFGEYAKIATGFTFTPSQKYFYIPLRVFGPELYSGRLFAEIALPLYQKGTWIFSGGCTMPFALGLQWETKNITIAKQKFSFFAQADVKTHNIKEFLDNNYYTIALGIMYKR